MIVATRPRLLHMPPMRSAISVSESSGKARRMLRRACLETPRKGPMRRASAAPTAEAQSSGKSLNTPKKHAAPQASRRSASRGALREKFGRVGVIAVADTTTGFISPAGPVEIGPSLPRHPHADDGYRDQTHAP